jgi:DNA-binding transcriptional MerR regulator
MAAVAEQGSLPRGPVAELMTIGEAARRSGFTVKALRFYGRQGLLPPTARSPAGYRLYSVADLERLEFIRQAKALGLDLLAIRELVVSARSQGRGMTRARLLRILAERITQTARQISTLTRLRQELQRRRQALIRRRCAGRGYCTCLHQSARARGSDLRDGGSHRASDRAPRRP